ncbi:hypothetical protein Droror1_Dr00017902 [Drosera rotundifolia]
MDCSSPRPADSVPRHFSLLDPTWLPSKERRGARRPAAKREGNGCPARGELGKGSEIGGVHHGRNETTLTPSLWREMKSSVSIRFQFDSDLVLRATRVETLTLSMPDRV